MEIFLCFFFYFDVFLVGKWGRQNVFRGFLRLATSVIGAIPRAKFWARRPGREGEEDDDKDIGLWYRHTSRGETIDTREKERKKERRGVKFQVPSINQSAGNDEI